MAAAKVGSPKAGDLIGGILARTWPVRNDQTLRSDSAADSATLGLTYGVVGNAFCQNPPPTINCFEDDDAHISYASSWHLVSGSSASAGHFRYHTGNPSNGMRFSFNVSGSSGALVYHYAKAKEDGLADVYIDNAYKGTINYEGSSGSGKKPQFGFNARYAGLAPGSHVFELRNIRGFAFVDRFCLEDSFLTSATASTGPGNTVSVLNTLAPLVDLVQTIQAPLGTQAISVFAESSDGSPVRLLLLDPLGGTVSTVTGSTGQAAIDAPVSLPGAYVVKVVNTGAAPSEVWLLATPWGSR
jgi:hypothetical protein